MISPSDPAATWASTSRLAYHAAPVMMLGLSLPRGETIAARGLRRATRPPRVRTHSPTCSQAALMMKAASRVVQIAELTKRKTNAGRQHRSHQMVAVVGWRVSDERCRLLAD